MSAVDIVVPCYNYARYLKDCVDSVLSQRDVDVRVLIIDDKSSDKTPEVGQQLAASDPRVTFRRHEINKGLIGTANEGFEWVEAPYWLLLSADDALTPGSLARATSVLDAHPEVGMVYGRAQVTGEERLHIDEPDVCQPTIKVIPGNSFIERNCKEGNPVPSPTAVLRTSLSRQLGGYCARFPHTSDMEYWMRIAIRAPIAVIRETQAFYRWHGANMAAIYGKDVVNDSRAQLDTCTYVYNTWSGASIGEFSFWIADLRRSLARQYYWTAGELMRAGRTEDADNCLKFAEECSSRHQRRVHEWKNRIKSVLSSEQISLLRKTKKAVLQNAETAKYRCWFDENNVFGWWPES